MTELPQDGTIGSYRVIRRIGQGGMGVVYEAEHVRLGTRHALKTFSHEGDDAGLFRKRFLAEGRLLARLNHPRIVRVHDMDLTDDGLAWFAMDLILSEDGKPKTLADVPRDGSVPEERLAAWFEDVREALRPCTRPGSSIVTSSSRTCCSGPTATRISPTSAFRRSPTGG